MSFSTGKPNLNAWILEGNCQKGEQDVPNAREGGVSNSNAYAGPKLHRAFK